MCCSCWEREIKQLQFTDWCVGTSFCQIPVCAEILCWVEWNGMAASVIYKTKFFLSV